jgi:phosphatidylglycerol lysyltransferase
MALLNAKPLSPGTEPREHVLSLLRRFGYSANSFQALQSQFEYWFCGRDACVAYVDTGAAWVVAGAPIAQAALCQQVARDFMEVARQRGRRVTFFGTESQFVDAAGFRSTLVGAQPSFTASDWRNRVSFGRELRRQLRRARAKGLHIESVTISTSVRDESMRSQLEFQQLVKQWLDSKPLPPMGFLTQVQPLSYPSEQRYLTARVAHELVGLAAMVPIYTRRGWLLENLMRAPGAPNGTIESLIEAAVTSAIDAGAEFVALGLTPLAGEVVAWLRVAKKLGAPLYNFVGLERFRAKLQPSDWSPIYLSYAAGHSAPLALYDCLVAFAHGSLPRFAIQWGLRWLKRAGDRRRRLADGRQWAGAIVPVTPPRVCDAGD